MPRTNCESGTKQYETDCSVQRHRMVVIAGWPESEYKQAVLAAAQTALGNRLGFEGGWPASPFARERGTADTR